MKVLALLLALLPIAASAQIVQFSGAPPSSVASCAQGSTYQDGCGGAPAGSANFSTILSSYTKRPPWNVAAVDYRVGIPSTTVLQDVTTATLPTGASYNSSTNTVTVSGNNVTLNGYDFSLHNGTLLTVTGANDTIENSYFALGSNQCPTAGSCTGTMIQFTSASSNPTMLNNEVNGNDIATTLQAGAMVTIASSGTATMHYNYFHDSGEDAVDVQASSSTQIDKFEYNAWYKTGVNTAHQDTIQWYNTTIGSGSSVGFNTVYQTVPQPGGGNGMLVPLSEGSSSTMTGLDEHNNTIITTSGCNNCNWAVGFYDDLSGTSDHVSVRDNFVDPTGINLWTGSPWFANCKTSSCGSALAIPMIEHDLTDMTSGSSIAVPSSTSQTSQGYYVYPDINGNSPSLSDIFAITTSPSSGNITTGNTITFTLSMAVTPGWMVTGTPTLTLNSGGTASYVSGSGTNTLTYSYTVGAGDTAATLAVSAINLAGGTIKDSYGNTANLTGPLTTFSGLSVNSGGGSAPVVTATSFNASSTNAPAAQSGQAIGTVSASNSPTGFSIASCSPSCSGWFAISSGGAVTVSSTGASNVVPTLSGATYTLSVTASNGSGTSSPASVPVTFYADGALTAPSGTAQLPTLFASYTHGRPPWKVAGVDYYVGLPSGTTLQDPTTATLPAGCSYGSHVVTCSTAGATLDKFDFTLHGGIGLSVNADNISVTNSKFGTDAMTTASATSASGTSTITLASVPSDLAVGMYVGDENGGGAIADLTTVSSIAGNVVTLSAALTNAVNSGDVITFNYGHAPLLIAGSNFYMANTTVDAAGIGDSSTFGGVLYVNSGSAAGITLEYNWFNNAADDFLDSETGTLVNRYNLMTYDGLMSGGHPDYNQQNPTSNLTTQQEYYNTWINALPKSTGGGQGTTYGDNGALISGNAIFSNNVTIANGSGSGVSISYWLHVTASQIQSGATVTVDDNWSDITTAYGFFYGGSSSTCTGVVTCARNTNLVTGGAL